MNSSELLSRPLAVRLNTRQFSRLAHEEVLNGIEEVIDVSLVKAIQITESICFVSLKNQEAKENIKSEMRSFKSNENIHMKEGGSYYVVSANKASSVTL